MGREAVAPLGVCSTVLVIVWVDDLVEEEVGGRGHVAGCGPRLVLALFGLDIGHLDAFLAES